MMTYKMYKWYEVTEKSNRQGHDPDSVAFVSPYSNIKVALDPLATAEAPFVHALSGQVMVQLSVSLLKTRFPGEGTWYEDEQEGCQHKHGVVQSKLFQ